MKHIQTVNLDQDELWLLYRALVCDKMNSMGYKGDAWQFSSCLDLSFEELSQQTVDSWLEQISDDAEEYRNDCPEDFEVIH